MRSELLVPGAIVAGAIIIAVGAFLGLRSREPAPPSPITLGPSPSVPAPAQGTATHATLGATATSQGNVTTAPVLEAPPSMGLASDKVVQEVRAQLDKHRARLVATCVAPAAKSAGRPIKVSLSYAIAFDKDGHERLRGINETSVDKDSWPAVVDCLRGVDAPVSAPASGAPFSVEIPMTLP